MTVYDYMRLCDQQTEITIYDKDYDIETYFYTDEIDKNNWNKNIWKLAKKLEVVKVGSDYSLTVNLSEIIEANIKNLKKKDLFTSYDIDIIMDSIGSILNGQVSEDWLKKFVNALTVKVEIPVRVPSEYRYEPVICVPKSLEKEIMTKVKKAISDQGLTDEEMKATLEDANHCKVCELTEVIKIMYV